MLNSHVDSFNTPTLLSSKITDKLPSFISNQYSEFSNFIKRYYEWVDTNSFSQLEFLVMSRNINDVDDSLINSYYDQFLNGFPKNPQADKRLVLKLIYMIYTSKGSEEAFRLFFLFFYNQKVKFYYPKVDLLKASDGKYKKQKSVKIFYQGNESFLNSVGFYIQGVTSGARAIVESSVSYFVSSFRIIELFLTEIKGNFLKAEEIFVEIDPLKKSNLLEVMSVINIDNPGTGYSVGDIINIVNQNSNVRYADTTLIKSDNVIFTADTVIGNTFSGIGARASVSSITKGVIESISIINGGSNYAVGESLIFSNVLGSTSAIAKISQVNGAGGITGVTLLSSGFNYKDFPNITVNTVNGSGASLVAQGSKIGGIKSINIIDFGINYDVAPVIDASNIGDGNAVLTSVSGSFCEYSGAWINQDGFLSDKKYLIDSLYYQDYSYVLRTSLPFDSYALNVKKLLHPAGMQFFGEELDNIEIDLGSLIDIQIITVNNILNYEILIGNLLAILEIIGVITNDKYPSLGMTYEIFDLMKGLISSEENENLNYFKDILLENFKDDEKYDNFDFVPATIKITDIS